MNKTGLLLLSAALACGCSSGQRAVSTSETYPKPKGVTRIVQYNVGAFSKEIGSSIPMVAAMMQELGADAVCLNELDSCNLRHSTDQTKEFAESMGGWNYRFGRAMPYLEGAYGVGVAVPGRILSSFVIPLPRGNGLEPRACCVVETREYVLASTHLDYKDMPSMVAQAEIINEELFARYGDSKKPVILAGDMNSIPGSPVLEKLSARWEILSCRKETFSSIRPRECIDYILKLRNKAVVKLSGTDVPVVFAGGDVKVASDHLPLFVDIKH